MNQITKVAFDIHDARKADEAHKKSGRIMRTGIVVNDAPGSANGYRVHGVSNRDSSKLSLYDSKHLSKLHDTGAPDHKASSAARMIANKYKTGGHTLAASTHVTYGNPVRAMSAGQGSNILAGVTGIHKDSIGRGDREMINRIVRHHEVNESVAHREISRATKAPPATNWQGTSHLSPTVILKEHNQVATLPAQHKKTKALMTSLRSKYGVENDLLQHVDKRLSYGNSPRLSRHAIKRISEAANRKGQMGDAMQMHQGLADNIRGMSHEGSDLGKATGSQARRSVSKIKIKSNMLMRKLRKMLV